MSSWTNREPHLAPTRRQAEVRRAVGVGTGHSVRALLHDLRQPLAAIRMLSEDSDDVRLVAIHAQAQWLADLVEEVLGATREHDPVVCRLQDVVIEAVGRFEASAPGVIMVGSTPPAYVLADRRALNRALGCILDNAVRAAGPEGRVRVDVHGAGGEVHVDIADDGPGLGRLSANNGMGLTIARALLATYGGGVVLLPGRSAGALARVVLPAVPTHQAVAS